MSTSRYETDEGASPAALAEPLHFEFSKKTAKNRFMKSSMAEALATWSAEDLSARGIPTKAHIELYRRQVLDLIDGREEVANEEN
jgi:hypothetical protein